MKLQDTIEMMNSSDFKERFRAEFYQLQNRICGLENMLFKYKNGTLPFVPSCSYELLHEQLVHMYSYKSCLIARAEIENIELDLSLKSL